MKKKKKQIQVCQDALLEKERENEKDGIGIKNHMQQDPEFEL